MDSVDEPEQTSFSGILSIAPKESKKDGSWCFSASFVAHKGILSRVGSARGCFSLGS